MSTLTHPRYAVQQTGNEIQITLPAKKVISQLIKFGALLICGFYFTGQIIYALTESIPYDNENRIIIFKVVMFIVGLILLVADGIAIYSFLWALFGKEVIKVNSPTMIVSLSRQIFGWKKAVIFSSKDVSNLRTNASQEKATLGSLQYALRNTGAIAFDYRAKTIHFGIDVDETEAEQIVSVLQQHLWQSKTG